MFAFFKNSMCKHEKNAISSPISSQKAEAMSQKTIKIMQTNVKSQGEINSLIQKFIEEAKAYQNPKQENQHRTTNPK